MPAVSAVLGAARRVAADDDATVVVGVFKGNRRIGANG